MCVNQKQKMENVERLDVSFAIYRLVVPGDNRIWDFILMKKTLEFKTFYVIKIASCGSWKPNLLSDS